MPTRAHSSTSAVEEPTSRLVTAAPSRAANPEVLSRLVAAARRCFARQGVSKTRMAHVAGEAGMVRQTAYDYVSGIDELVTLVLVERAREIADMVVERIGRGPRDAAEAMVQHLALLVELTRDDPEFVSIVDAMTRGPALRFLTASSRIEAIVGECLRPRFDQARRQGVLRDAASESEMAAWLQSCLTPLAARSDLSAAELRHTIRTFVLPAVLHEAP
jgi:AcrR family transcriptional regulator